MSLVDVPTSGFVFSHLVAFRSIMKIKAKYTPSVNSSWSNLPEIWLSGVEPPDFPILNKDTYTELGIRACIDEISCFVALCTEALDFIDTRQFRQVVFQHNRKLCVPFRDWIRQAGNTFAEVEVKLGRDGIRALEVRLSTLYKKLQPLKGELNNDDWLGMNIGEASYAFLASKYGPEPGWIQRANDIPCLHKWLEKLSKLAPTTICLDPFAHITASTYFRWKHEPFREWEKQIRIARFPPRILDKLRCALKILSDLASENEYKERCKNLMKAGLSQERNNLITESINKGRLALRNHNINFSGHFAGHDLKAFLPAKEFVRPKETKPKPEDTSITRNRSSGTSKAPAKPISGDPGPIPRDLGVPSKEANSGDVRSTFIGVIIPPCAACQCLFFEESDALKLPPEPLGNNFDLQHPGQCAEVATLVLLLSFMRDYCPEWEWEYTADLSPKGETSNPPA